MRGMKQAQITPPTLPQLHTPEAFARAACVHPESVRRAIRAGRIRAVKIGTGWRIPHGEATRIMGGAR